MRQVRDNTGRFSLRPHYQPLELDQACEKVLSEFFRPICGAIPTPISTDDLTKLIERDVSDFDPGADLNSYGDDVEGVTEFRAGHKPRVRISAELAYEERRENRYRTTLTHEYGHVHFHSYLFAIEPRGVGLFDVPSSQSGVQVCKRETLINAPTTDWMEWQAGYVCGALLMPLSQLRRLVGTHQKEHGLFGPVMIGSPHATALIDLVRKSFRVSADAARIRLLKLDFLGSTDRGPSLFARSDRP